MTCPACSRSTRDFTNSSGLVTRCDDAWHTTGIHCPAYGLHGCKHEGSGCVGMVCVEWGKTPVSGAAKAVPDASKDSHSPATPEDFVRPEAAQAVGRHASWPFQEDPRPLKPAQNGFIHCAICESVQPAAGHECVPAAEWVEDCRMCHFPVLSDGHGLVCSGCASEEDRKRVIRRAARGGGR